MAKFTQKSKWECYLLNKICRKLLKEVNHDLGIALNLFYPIL